MKKRKPLIQATLFSSEQMEAMKTLPAKDPEPAPDKALNGERVRTVFGTFTVTDALADMMRDNGYDSFESFLCGQEPKKQHKRKK